jgi:ABC-type nickel/cobalt efflux system permease component RcnA
MRALARARGAGSAGEGGAGEGGGHAGCGHRHGPDAAEVARLSGWRDAALLVGGIAIRPCTGAIFLLVIAWRFDLVWQGLVAVVAMGLGTAAFTVLVAVGGVAARGATLFASAGGGRAGALALPVLQLGAGLGVALLATGLLAGSLRL